MISHKRLNGFHITCAVITYLKLELAQARRLSPSDCSTSDQALLCEGVIQH